MAPSAYCQRKEMRTRKSVQGEGNQGAKGVCMLPARLKELQCLGDFQKTMCFQWKERGMLCLDSPECSKFEVGR